MAYKNGLGTCDALLCVAHTLQSALEMGQEDRIVQIDFSAAFDRVNHEGIIFKLCSVGVGGSVLSVLTIISPLVNDINLRQAIENNKLSNDESKIFQNLCK